MRKITLYFAEAVFLLGFWVYMFSYVKPGFPVIIGAFLALAAFFAAIEKIFTENQTSKL